MDVDANVIMARSFARLLKLDCGRAPFLTLPQTITSHEELMEFDRNICKRYQQFRRRAHQLESRQPEIYKVVSGPNPPVYVFDPGWVILVAEITPAFKDHGAFRVRILLTNDGKDI